MTKELTKDIVEESTQNIQYPPDEVTSLINHYKNLKIRDKLVKVPYYINVKRVRGGLRALVGKGSPEEIEEETLIFSKLRGFDLTKHTPEEIRAFMKSQGIGLDCSGFVSHALATWLEAEKQGSLFKNLKYPKENFIKRFKRRLRYIENTSANLLTSSLNTQKIEIKDVNPGDLIRLKALTNGHHIAIVTKTVRDLNNNLIQIFYTHSTNHYGTENGIHEGEIQITDLNKDLKDQNWKELDSNGVCWTLKQLLKDYEDNGLRRPNFFINKR